MSAASRPMPWCSRAPPCRPGRSSTRTATDLVNMRTDMIGRKFGMLTIRQALPDRLKCVCDCDCGVKGSIKHYSNVRSGKTKSCGCAKAALTAKINYKGGRSVTSKGYVLILVGTSHHLADVRGYAYEHRLVAEEKIGRPLLPGEQVHHIDGNKQNNVPGNIAVVTAAEHIFQHRKRMDKQKPREMNVIVECACGCGTRFYKYDSGGRPRRYAYRHRLAKLTKQEVIEIRLAFVREGCPLRTLAERFGVVTTTISRIVRGRTWAVEGKMPGMKEEMVKAIRGAK